MLLGTPISLDLIHLKNFAFYCYNAVGNHFTFLRLNLFFFLKELFYLVFRP